MLDCVDYLTETSNDEKLPFLELIEAVSRSHRDSLSNDTRYLNTNDFYNFTVSSQLDLCVSSAGHENITTYCTSMEGDDHLNMTDCDLNLLVDPRNGKPLNDDEDEISDQIMMQIKEEKLDDISISDLYKQEQEVKNETENDFTESEFDFHPSFSNEEITDTSTQFNSVPVKIEPSEPSPTKTHQMLQTEDPRVVNSSNRVLLIQIASPLSNDSKLKKNENVYQQTCQIKSVLPQNEKYDKPPFSYSCLIAMALKNSENGYLPVSEIYSYIIDKFPYFKTAPDGWKNSIRHNLSLNKCFQKLETPSLNGTTRKACLWGLNEAKVSRLNEEISKWIKKGNDVNGKKYCSSPELTSRHFLNKPLILNEDAQHGNVTSDSWTNKFSSPSDNQAVIDPTEFKLYKLVKVSKNNCGMSPDAKEVRNRIVDPIFANINNQTFSWEDLLETSELKSFSTSPLANQRVTFRTGMCNNDSPLSLTTVRASA